jgi:hypothetical protein
MKTVAPLGGLAIAATDASGRQLAYSIFQQAAGPVNAAEAASSMAFGCANRGLSETMSISVWVPQE